MLANEFTAFAEFEIHVYAQQTIGGVTSWAYVWTTTMRRKQIGRQRSGVRYSIVVREEKWEIWGTAFHAQRLFCTWFNCCLGENAISNIGRRERAQALGRVHLSSAFGPNENEIITEVDRMKEGKLFQNFSFDMDSFNSHNGIRPKEQRNHIATIHIFFHFGSLQSDFYGQSVFYF